MQVDGNILRRCKQVIQELQGDLTKRTMDCQKKDQIIQDIMLQRNQQHSKNQQLQKLMYELKQVNVVLRSELKKAENSSILKTEVQRLQNELNQTIIVLESKQLEIRQYEQRLRQQAQNKKGQNRELSLAMRDIMERIQMLQQQIKLKQQQNKQLKNDLSSRKCEYCEAISDIKTLSNLRKRIDQNLRSNTKISNQNIFKTASTKKSFSQARQLSNRKSNGNIVNNRFKLTQQDKSKISIQPFTLYQNHNSIIFPTDNTVCLKRTNSSLKQQAVNRTLRQIQQKLQKMNEKLAELEDSDMSILSIR